MCLYVNKKIFYCLRLTYYGLLFCLAPLLLHAQTPDTTGAYVMRTRAHNFIKEGKYKAAFPLLQHADSLYRLTNDTSGRAFCLYQQALYYYNQSNIRQAEYLLRQVINLLRYKDEEEATYLGKAWDSLIGILVDKGDFEAATDSCRRQIQYYEQHPHKNKSVLAHLYASMENIAGEQNRYEESIYYCKKVLTESRDTALIYRACHDIATSFFYLGHLDSSAHYLQIVEEILASRSLAYQLYTISGASFYVNAGYIYAEKEDFNKALEYFYKSKNLVEKSNEPDKELILYIHSNIGRVYAKRKQYEQALSEFQSVLAVMDSMQDKPLRVMAQVWSSTAVCYAWLGDTLNAEKYWHMALTDSLSRQFSTSLISIYKDIVLYKHAHKKYTEEIALYEQIIQIIQQRNGAQYPELAAFYAGLANALNHVGRYDEALTWVDKALKIHCPADDCFQAQSESILFDNVLVADALPGVLLAKGEALMGKWRDHPDDRSLLDAASQAAEQAQQAVVFFRQRHQGVGVESYEWLQKNRQIYALGVRTAARRNDVETAFQRADQSRAVLLTESARAAEAKQFAGVSASLLDQERYFSQRIAYYERLALESAQDETPDEKYKRDTILFSLRRAQRALSKRLERDYPRYYAMRYDSRPVHSKDMQAQLAPAAAFIEYFLDETESRLYIFVVDAQHGLRMQTITWDDQINQQILQLHQLSQSVLLKRTDSRLRFIAQSHALYRLFIQPILSYIQDKNQLVIVAEGDLHYLPFDLLLEDGQDRPFEQLPYLLRRYAVAYQYSAALYLRNVALPVSQADPSTPFVVFAPTFGATNQFQSSTIRNQGAGDNGSAVNRFQPLPYSEVEARTLAELLGTSRTTLLLNKDAHEADLKAALSRPCRITHLATHSFADKERPQFSGIACYKKEDNTEDGILYAGEIYGLDIHADLIVLSSCESGVGKSGGGEGLLGLNRAFAYAGVPNVLYSLWKINDKATSELMIAFYKQVLTGKTYAEALRAAKLKLVENTVTASPNFWGGFSLMGVR